MGALLAEFVVEVQAQEGVDLGELLHGFPERLGLEGKEAFTAGTILSIDGTLTSIVMTLLLSQPWL